MNRSFYAFGWLLAALGGGMFAVGSTSSRGSVAQAAPEYSQQRVERVRVVYCDYALVLPHDEPGEEWAAGRYEDSCGLDRITGDVYSESHLAPRPVAIEWVEPAAELSSRTLYDAAYDRAMFAAQNGAQAEMPPFDSDQPWLSEDELRRRETLEFFHSLAAAPPPHAVRYPFFDQQAAKEYAAAELAAAVENGREDLPAQAEQHVPWFSAVICSLPDSTLAERLRPLTIALQVRGTAGLEWCGLLDDCQAAVALFTPATRAAVEQPLPAWEDYEKLFDGLAQQPALAGDEGIASQGGWQLDSASRAALTAAANLLSQLSDVSATGAEQLRRIIRPSVAKLHSSDFNASEQR